MFMCDTLDISDIAYIQVFTVHIENTHCLTIQECVFLQNETFFSSTPFFTIFWKAQKKKYSASVIEWNQLCEVPLHQEYKLPSWHFLLYFQYIKDTVLQRCDLKKIALTKIQSPINVFSMWILDNLAFLIPNMLYTDEVWKFSLLNTSIFNNLF